MVEVSIALISPLRISFLAPKKSPDRTNNLPILKTLNVKTAQVLAPFKPSLFTAVIFVLLFTLLKFYVIQMKLHKVKSISLYLPYTGFTADFTVKFTVNFTAICLLDYCKKEFVLWNN